MANTTNQKKLQAFVAFHVENAGKKADPVAYLIGWAGFVDAKMADLGTDKPGMEGLTAWDIAEARDALGSAASAYERRAAA